MRRIIVHDETNTQMDNNLSATVLQTTCRQLILSNLHDSHQIKVDITGLSSKNTLSILMMVHSTNVIQLLPMKDILERRLSTKNRSFLPVVNSTSKLYIFHLQDAWSIKIILHLYWTIKNGMNIKKWTKKAIQHGMTNGHSLSDSWSPVQIVLPSACEAFSQLFLHHCKSMDEALFPFLNNTGS